MVYFRSLKNSNSKNLAIQILRKLVLQEDGQAIVEYLLAMSVSLIIVSRLTGAIRSSLRVLWEALANEIAPACPGCKNVGGEVLKIR